MTTVQIPILGEKWRMPNSLKEQLYEFLIFKSKGNIVPCTFKNWFSELPEQEQKTIVRVCLS